MVNPFWLPTDLARVVLDFAGSLAHKQHRLHRFLQFEFKICTGLQIVSPSQLVRFYRDNGAHMIQDVVWEAYTNL